MGGEEEEKDRQASVGQMPRLAMPAAMDAGRGHGKLEQVQRRKLGVGGAGGAVDHPFDRQALTRPGFETLFEASIGVVEEGPQFVILAAFVVHEPFLCMLCLSH
mgnify:FL=1